MLELLRRMIGSLKAVFANDEVGAGCRFLLLAAFTNMAPIQWRKVVASDCAAKFQSVYTIE
jgi:hypothetical protein